AVRLVDREIELARRRARRVPAVVLEVGDEVAILSLELAAEELLVAVLDDDFAVEIDERLAQVKRDRPQLLRALERDDGVVGARREADVLRRRRHFDPPDAVGLARRREDELVELRRPRVALALAEPVAKALADGRRLRPLVVASLDDVEDVRDVEAREVAVV